MPVLEQMRCDHEGRFRAPSQLIELTEQAAKRDLLGMSAYIRKALVRQLESDGFDRQTELGRQ